MFGDTARAANFQHHQTAATVQAAHLFLPRSARKDGETLETPVPPHRVANTLLQATQRGGRRSVSILALVILNINIRS